MKKALHLLFGELQIRRQTLCSCSPNSALLVVLPVKTHKKSPSKNQAASVHYKIRAYANSSSRNTTVLYNHMQVNVICEPLTVHPRYSVSEIVRIAFQMKPFNIQQFK